MTSFTPVITYILINGMFVFWFWEEEVALRRRRERRMRMTMRREGRTENDKNERNFLYRRSKTQHIPKESNKVEDPMGILVRKD